MHNINCQHCKGYGMIGHGENTKDNKMQKTIFMTMVIFLFLASSAFAGLTGAVKVYNTTPSDSESIVQSSTGFQVALKYTLGSNRNPIGIFPYVSCEQVPIRFGGQRGVDIELLSVGVGAEREIASGLSLFCQIGWFMPKWGQDGELIPLTHGGEHLAEGLWLYLNNKLTPLEPIKWEAYSLSYSGSIGGVIGVEYVIPIVRHVDLKLMGSYRHLKLQEMIKGKDSWNTTSCWEFKQERDFSGFQTGVSIEVKF